MNFIGHLLVAGWQRDDPAFGLGAMLPDFASMAGIRPPPIQHTAVAEGVALHHRTDDVFHGCPTFVELSRDVFQELVQAGVERGPARAVAHIGVELLIDGELLQREPALGSAYLSALTAFESLPPDALPAPQRGPLDRLQRRLATYGIPYDYQRPDLVTARLISILGRRPRLALSATSAASVGLHMPALQARVAEHLSELLSSLAHGLSHPRYSAG
jgi:acyl carrier protein phosphodiesterase